MKQNFKINEYCLHKILVVKTNLFLSKSQSYLIGHQKHIFVFFNEPGKKCLRFFFCSSQKVNNLGIKFDKYLILIVIEYIQMKYKGNSASEEMAALSETIKQTYNNNIHEDKMAVSYAAATINTCMKGMTRNMG